MTTYALNPSRFTSGAALQAAVGEQYHLGLSDGTVYYGYILEPDNTKNGGFRQRSDALSHDALTNYASPNLIDRDLVLGPPRVTDGDFSGGGYQEVWIDPKRYFDSDLDPRVPGYLQLRPNWTRVSVPGITPGLHNQVVAFASDFFFTFGEANGNVYSANGGATGTASGGAVLSLDTDGTLLYAGTATGLWSSTNGASWTQITSSINGTATQWWVINQGTNGYFAYYQSGPNLLYKIDLTLASPQAAAAQPQVPLGANALNIIDLCEYQTSIAILTTDARALGFDVWYFDGTNLTRIIRMDGYHGDGICSALGSLFVGAHDLTGGTSPILTQVDSGSFQIVAKPGSPFVTALNQSCLQPRSASHFVYWPLLAQSINGISRASGVIVQYDTLSGAIMHLPDMDAADFNSTGTGTLRAVAALADSVACCFTNGTTGILQYQQAAFGTVKYQLEGWLASSHIDFATPAIQKRFRRIEVHHSPLNAGESIGVVAYVDSDPIDFAVGLPAVPIGAQVLNTTVGTTLTAMTFGVDTIGKTLYYALFLGAGTNQATTPRVSYVSIEVGGTWAWEVSLGCSSKRGLLDSEETETQPTGKDLAYLPLLAYENGTNLTLYHRNGQSYTVAIDSVDFWNPSPMASTQPQDIRDEEYIVHLIMRQVA